MYYRYEMRTGTNDTWQGCFQFFFPDQRRYIGKWLKEPSWYSKHPDVDSRCWFTEAGFQKYGDMVEQFIQERLDTNPEWEMRLLKTDILQNFAMKGKIQCIEII